MLNYYLLLVLHNPFDQPLNAICLLWLKNPHELAFQPPSDVYSDRAVMEQLRIAQRRLQGLSKGLLILEPDYSPSLGFCPMFSQRVQFFHRSARDYIDTAERRKELEHDFPAFDPQRSHFLLRMGEIAFVNQWNVSSSQALAVYGLGALAMKDKLGQLYKHPYSHLKLMEKIWQRHFRNRCAFQSVMLPPMAGIVSIAYDPTRSSNRFMSFLHLAA